MWWTLSPSRSATYIFRGVAATGGNVLSLPRIAASNSSISYYGLFRLRVTS